MATSPMVLRETCPCGATFTYDGPDHLTYTHELTQRFRDAHAVCRQRAPERPSVTMPCPVEACTFDLGHQGEHAAQPRMMLDRENARWHANPAGEYPGEPVCDGDDRIACDLPPGHDGGHRILGSQTGHYLAVIPIRDGQPLRLKGESGPNRRAVPRCTFDGWECLRGEGHEGSHVGGIGVSVPDELY